MFDVASSKDYEKVAQQVYQAILASDDVDTIEVMHNVQVVGRSGVKHQIDVYWRDLQDGIEHQVLVECKYYSSTIDLIHARNLLGLNTDIPNSRGVLLTTVGFQRGVVDLGEYYGISLKRLRNPQGSDWDDCIQKVEIQGTLHNIDYLNVSINLDSKDLEAYTASAPDEETSINPLDYKLQDGTAPSASLSSG